MAKSHPDAAIASEYRPLGRIDAAAQHQSCEKGFTDVEFYRGHTTSRNARTCGVGLFL